MAHTQTQQAPIMVRPSQAKEVFGVHRATLYRWAAEKHIKIHKRGKMSFVDPNEVRAFIMGDQQGDQSGESAKT